MRYHKYDKYQSSELSWLGDIPISWEIRRLKFSVDLANDKHDAKDTDLEYMGLEHIDSWTGKRIEVEESQSDGLGSKFIIGDVLFGKLRPYLAKVYLAEREGLATTEALVLRPYSGVNSNYLKYYLLSRDFINVVDSSTYGAKMPRANWEFIGNLPFLLPDTKEQQKIADFLDYKTQQIDQLIKKKKALIEKLNEQRIAVITQAVTKGMDKNVKMKPSGVDWLGDVPEHWDVKPLKFCCDSLNNQRIPLSGEERTGMSRTYPYYGASGIIDYVEDYLFDEPTVLVAEDGANLLSRSTDLAFEAHGKYWVNNHAHILRPIEGPFSYWSNLLCSIQYDPWITGAAQPKLTKENLGSIALPSPPLLEQEQIAIFVEDVVNKIDPMIVLANRTVANLEEYRSAIITDAVTGKIDVRNIQIPAAEDAA